MDSNISPNHDFIHKLTRIVLANLGRENFGGAELAREAGMSRTNLNRKLKSALKKSAGQFIREIRLYKALEMLQQEEGTASEIAYRAGFGSPTHFNAVFHEFFGFTPGEAKKRAHTDNSQAEGHFVSEQPSASMEPETVKSPTITKKITGKKIRLSAAILAICVMTIFVFITIFDDGFFPPWGKNEKSIAILPFINDSPDSTNVYFNNGIAEAIIDRLANIKDLKVTSRITTEKYRNTGTMDIRRIARKLKVNYIVEGSGQKIGDQVLITVQLIDARKDKHILSKQFPRKYEDIFNLYSDIALAVAGKIKAVITPGEKDLLNKPPEASVAAMKMFIQGEDRNVLKYYNPSQSMEFINQAELYYRKAIHLDSAYSDAWVQLGEICLNKGKIDSALFYAEKALQVNEQNAGAYFLEGLVYSKKRDATAMDRSFNQALWYNPDDPWTIHWSGVVHYYRGEFSEAVEALLKTRQILGNLNPRFSNFDLYQLEYNDLHLARVLFGLGFYDEGKSFLDRWLEISENESWGYNYNLMWAGIINNRWEFNYKLGIQTPENKLQIMNMIMNLLFMGKYSEIPAYYAKGKERWKKMSGENASLFSILGYAYMNLGQNNESERYYKSSFEYVDTLLANHPEQKKPLHAYALSDRYWQYSWFVLTSLYAAKGDKENALKYLLLLKDNFLANDLQVVTFLRSYPLFEPIRNEPEFQDYLHEAETHYNKEHKKVEAILRREGLLK